MQSKWAAKTYLQTLWVGHGLTDKGYRELWAKQNGRCPGCHGQLAHPTEDGPEGLKPMVEGAKGQVTGLFCGECRKLLHELRERLPVVKRLMETLK